MNKVIGLLGVVLSLVVPLSVASQDIDKVAKAASHFAPEVRWVAGTSLSLDFTCRGLREFALLGFQRQIGPAFGALPSAHGSTAVVAIFTEGLVKPPKLLHVTDLAAKSTVLALESLNHPSSELKADLGVVPLGWRRSRTCKGLSLDDGETDPSHFYWQTSLGGVAMWRH